MREGVNALIRSVAPLYSHSLSREFVGEVLALMSSMPNNPDWKWWNILESDEERRDFMVERHIFMWQRAMDHKESFSAWLLEVFNVKEE